MVFRHEKIEWYEELCALDAIGELSTMESRELRLHLEGCAECRTLHAEFCRLASDDLTIAAVERAGGEPPQKVCEELQHEQELLSRVLQTARQRTTSNVSVSGDSARDAMQPPHTGFRVPFARSRPISAWISAGLLAAATVVLILVHRNKSYVPSVEVVAVPRTALRPAPALEPVRISGEEPQVARKVEAERLQFEKRFADEATKYDSLLAEYNKTESELAARSEEVERLNHDLAASKESQNQKDKMLDDLAMKLQQAELRIEDQRRIVSSLEKQMQGIEQEARDGEGANADFNGKNVLGARDLHIVDVYDVDSSGKTQRTYGRVFYIEKKLLVFYAFDLDDKNRNRSVGGFQAWGYRQPNTAKPEDLGLFTVEDAKLSRWVLTVKDARVLERIDAVFVTAEPAGGSPRPRGRKVLFANLAGPPNHP